MLPSRALEVARVNWANRVVPPEGCVKVMLWKDQPESWLLPLDEN